MSKIVVICGPTATGKTKLALTLAKRIGGELVSADSRQIYKGLDALTGKDRSLEIPIWLYDVINAGQEFSAAHFVNLAGHIISDIHKRNKLPIIVGGAGFYLRALTENIDTIAIPPNLALRKKLDSSTLISLQEKLQTVDAKRWSHMNNSDRQNVRRLIRAIEVAKFHRTRSQETPKYGALWIGLNMPLSALKEKIEERVKKRWGKAISEVRHNLPPILGADPLIKFLQGKISKKEALDQWVKAEYHYAKRQMTWFKKQNNIHWFDITKPRLTARVTKLVSQWYTRKT